MDNLLSWSVGKYGAINGAAGGVSLFSVARGVTSRSRADEEKFELHCQLAGVKSLIGYFPDEKSAKEKAESVCVWWLKKTGFMDAIMKECAEYHKAESQ